MMEGEDFDLGLPVITLPQDFGAPENIFDDLPHAVDQSGKMDPLEEVLQDVEDMQRGLRYKPLTTSTPITMRTVSSTRQRLPSLTNDSGFIDTSSIYTLAGSFNTTCSSVLSTSHFPRIGGGLSSPGCLSSPIEAPRRASHSQMFQPIVFLDLSPADIIIESKSSPPVTNDSLDANRDFETLNNETSPLSDAADSCDADLPTDQLVPSLTPISQSHTLDQKQLLHTDSAERDSAFSEGSQYEDMTLDSYSAFDDRSHNQSTTCHRHNNASFTSSTHSDMISLDLSSNASIDHHHTSIDCANSVTSNVSWGETFEDILDLYSHATPGIELHSRNPLQSSTPFPDSDISKEPIPRLALGTLEEESIVKCIYFPLNTPSLHSCKEDLMGRLIREKFSPREPDRLIGRKMGLGKLDIITELQRLSTSCFQRIMDYLAPVDIASSCCVSETWNKIIVSDKKLVAKKQEYVDSCLRLLAVKENLGKAALHRERLVSDPRQPLTDVQVTYQSKEVAMEAGVTATKHKQFWDIGTTLVNEETLVKCPRCDHAAKAHMVEDRGVCTHEQCQYDFCLRCTTAFHGAKTCPGSRPTTIKKSKFDSTVTSKKSKKNLRRL